MHYAIRDVSRRRRDDALMICACHADALTCLRIRAAMLMPLRYAELHAGCRHYADAAAAIAAITLIWLPH